MNESDKKELEALLKEVVRSNNADKNYGAIKSAIGLLPGVGGAVAEFYSMYISPPATQRLYNFLEAFLRELRNLETQVNSFNIESLQENSAFITMLMNALNIATRNHQEEKLNALRNLLLNAALPNSVEDDVKLLFLDLLNDLKVSHLHLLYILHEPDTYREKETVLNELEEKKQLYSHFLKQLIDNGLICFEGFNKKAYAILEEEDNDSLSFPTPTPYTRILSGGVPITRYSRYYPEKRRKMKVRESEEKSKNIDLVIQLIKNNKGKGYTTEFGSLFIQFISSPLRGSEKY